MIAYHKLLLSRWADISLLKSSGFIVPNLATYSPLDMSVYKYCIDFYFNQWHRRVKCHGCAEKL
jgi:hypothetical protein